MYVIKLYFSHDRIITQNNEITVLYASFDNERT